jgi:hypothetical protein
MNGGTSAKGELWRQWIDRQKISGMSAASFCRRHSLAVATFYFWKRRLSGQARSSAFVEIRPLPVNAVASCAATSGGTRTSIELCLRGGHRLRLRRGFDRQLLLDVLAALEGES